MRVYTARIMGFFTGLIFGGVFISEITILALVVGLITGVEIFMKKGRIMKGPLAGLAFGILAGYFLRDLIFQSSADAILNILSVL